MPIAALTRCAVSGNSLNLTPAALATALAMAAAVGPCAASPVPRNGWPGPQLARKTRPAKAFGCGGDDVASPRVVEVAQPEIDRVGLARLSQLVHEALDREDVHIRAEAA